MLHAGVDCQPGAKRSQGQQTAGELRARSTALNYRAREDSDDRERFLGAPFDAFFLRLEQKNFPSGPRGRDGSAFGAPRNHNHDTLHGFFHVWRANAHDRNSQERIERDEDHRHLSPRATRDAGGSGAYKREGAELAVVQ